MADVWDFKCGQIVGARLTGASVTKMDELFGVAKRTARNIMTDSEKKGEPPH